ncbi:tyrosine-protein kinase family protein [Adonisia turfae]|uniref:AAA domain-containing protein n=1 Tax=Adonisia turfae CCMR0081 TaxID=2292702 RepID=A0A6M0RJ11_9CYAN|nr:AAA family ATPase [Adonisia turfae]NEZ55823.1 hypothetical protein [Adonisia turfae CCMR0081]
MGSIVTFYSFKGGVGRTMALANIAVLLAQMGKKVLMIDWDLEAPGLPNYFSGFEIKGNNSGLLDLLLKSRDSNSIEELSWQEYVSRIKLGSNCYLYMISSGSSDENYNGKVLTFDWELFFEKFNGGELIESLRDDWRKAFDFVLIDSRTGITDSGGICTIQVPDALAVIFTANYQSLHGVKDIVSRAQKARQSLDFDRMPLLILPIPSRFDSRTEFKESQKWIKIFEKELTPFYADWLSKGNTPIEVIERTKLPYVAFFSFGEKLPVLVEGTSDPESLGRAYLTNAVLILELFQDPNTDEISRAAPSDKLDNLAEISKKLSTSLNSINSNKGHNHDQEQPPDFAVVSAPKYICPEGDYTWYRFDISDPIPTCPTHHCSLEREDA